jgi:thiamine biosynthesis protein ThiS
MQKAETKVPNIVINGEPTAVSAGLSVAGLLAEMEIAPDRVAIELNGRIVRQPEWNCTKIEPGAQIEIVQFVGGG